MKVTSKKIVLSLVLCLVLTWTAALFTGCTDSTTESPEVSGTPAVTTEAPATEKAPATDAEKLGEGDTVFTFTVTDKDKNDTVFEISTDKTTVGDALLELGLIEGEDGPYGLYVKKVNGITADYDKDKTYWSFYVNGEYALTGVDSTNIVAGDTYSFKIEK